MAKAIGITEVEILRFFETGPVEKAEVVFNIVREKMRERLRDCANGDGEAHEPRPRRRRTASRVEPSNAGDPAVKNEIS